jgi:hypothetical protein
MLDTIREFALDQLVALDEDAHSKSAFARSMLALAHRVDLRGPLQDNWGPRLDAEWPNLRAALAWSVEHNEVAAGSEILWAIMANWLTTNLQAVEAAEWSERLIALSVSHPPEVRAMALLAGGKLSLTLGQNSRGRCDWSFVSTVVGWGSDVCRAHRNSVFVLAGEVAGLG